MDGKKQPVSFMIEPPDASDLAQKRHAEIIFEYLTKQKVKSVCLPGFYKN